MKINIIYRLLNKIRLRYKNLQNNLAGQKGSAKYWTSHIVAERNWKSSKESLDYFIWRNEQYPGYIELMPVNLADDLVVMDYGCGPGNDLVGFSEFSKPKKLIGVDVSGKAIQVAKKRLELHRKPVDFIHILEENNMIDLPDESVDLVHSSGVLHHVKNLSLAIKEIHRVMKPKGQMQIMVYNYDSIWVHLYTAYVQQIELGKYSDLSLLEAFAKTTDGPYCPISKCYKPKEFVDIICSMGFEGSFIGSSISIHELSILHKRFDAISNEKLYPEQRKFLSTLTFNEMAHPLHNNHVAGIGACYKFVKI